MMTVEITGTPDLNSIITVAQLKEHLRVDHTDEDTLIEAYRDAAIAWIEDYHLGAVHGHSEHNADTTDSEVVGRYKNQSRADHI
jgi:hypothetical protein